MSLLSTILAPLDGSKLSEATLSLLDHWADPETSELVLFQVVDQQAATVVAYPDVPFSVDYRELERDAAGYLERSAKRLRDRGFRVRTDVRIGMAAATIVDRVDASDTTLVAMATHGRTGIARWAMGSVTEKVVRSCHRPVLVVRPPAGDEATSYAGIRNILVPIDGSEASLAVVPAVTELLAVHDAQVTVAHFVSDYFGGAAMVASEAYLDRAREAFHAAGVDVAVDKRRGEPAASIVDYGLFEADQPRIDLIAMSSRGRSGVARLLMGSVAARVLRHAVVPVLICSGEPRSPERETT